MFSIDDVVGLVRGVLIMVWVVNHIIKYDDYALYDIVL